MTFTVRLPVNYRWMYAIVLALPIAANFADIWRTVPSIVGAPAAVELRSWSERASAAFLAFILLTHWFAMLKPEASADGVSMHLAIPANIAANHFMTFEPSRIVWAVMPMGADFTYAIVYLMGKVTREEDDAVVGIAREVSGVERVVKVFEYTD